MRERVIHINFWFCSLMLPVNLITFFVAVHLKDRQLQEFLLLTMAVCAVGALANYFQKHE